jgi:NitT/TauT family transport system ATP-binding protein/nitrate/nitrite transport system substrate-binding protein
MSTSLTLGFIPLSDCALLAVAKERGLFEAEGLDVRLSREASWANIRDKVASGVLDGAHMLAPMAIASALGAGGAAAPMTAPLSLNVHGSSIGVSAKVAQTLAAMDAGTAGEGPATAQALKRYIDQRRTEGQPPLTFAVVFPFSIHNYMLRYWLADAGIDPDRDVRITVVPPPRIAARVASGELDGFSVGAPWGGAVEASGAGRMVLHGAEFWRGAPDKVFGVTNAFAERRPAELKALLRALVRASAWADDPANDGAVAQILSEPAYLALPPAALGRALSHANPFGLRFLSGGAGYPRPDHALWLLSQMRRWGQVEPAPGQEQAAQAVYRPDLYLEALGETGIAAPPLSALPPLFDGRTFDPSRLDDDLAQFPLRRRPAPAQ